MKKTIVCFVLAFVMLLIAFPTFADSGYFFRHTNSIPHSKDSRETFPESLAISYWHFLTAPR